MVLASAWMAGTAILVGFLKSVFLWEIRHILSVFFKVLGAPMWDSEPSEIFVLALGSYIGQGLESVQLARLPRRVYFENKREFRTLLCGKL